MYCDLTLWPSSCPSARICLSLFPVPHGNPEAGSTSSGAYCPSLNGKQEQGPTGWDPAVEILQEADGDSPSPAISAQARSPPAGSYRRVTASMQKGRDPGQEFAGTAAWPSWTQLPAHRPCSVNAHRALTAQAPSFMYHIHYVISPCNECALILISHKRKRCREGSDLSSWEMTVAGNKHRF